MIVNADCMDWLAKADPVRTLFADIPDNIGLEYVGISDKHSPEMYFGWVEALLLRMFVKADIIWLSYNARWHLEIGNILYWTRKTRHPSWNYHQILWRYNFSQYKDDLEPYGYRILARFWKPSAKLNFDAIRIPSVRMEIGDIRAAGPRIPDNVWDFPRVNGNFKERRSWHPTQHPEALMERVIRLSGGTFVDLFLGSGTTAIVCERLGIPWIGVEQSKYYCDRVAEELAHLKGNQIEGHLPLVKE